MIDRKHIGRAFGPYVAEVEKSRVRFFAKAIGETSPVFRDEAAARDAGFSAIPVPPTFLFCLAGDPDDPFHMLDVMDIDLGRVLHGEQSFTYHAPVHVGDRLVFSERVTDIYDKKGGALEFVVMDVEGRKHDGTLVVEMRKTLVVRNG